MLLQLMPGAPAGFHGLPWVSWSLRGAPSNVGFLWKLGGSCPKRLYGRTKTGRVACSGKVV